MANKIVLVSCFNLGEASLIDLKRSFFRSFRVSVNGCKSEHFYKRVDVANKTCLYTFLDKIYGQ